jgi:hypothetical protein
MIFILIPQALPQDFAVGFSLEKWEVVKPTHSEVNVPLDITTGLKKRVTSINW